MIKKEEIILAFDFRYTLQENKGFKPSIIEYSSGYEERLGRINQILSVRTIEEILKILSLFPDMNFKDMERLIEISHPAMWEHINNLEALELVKKEKKKLEGERKEFKINLHQNVDVVQLAVFEYNKIINEDKDGTKIKDSVSSSNSKTLKRIGFPGKQIVTDKNAQEIIEAYRKRIEMRLKASNIPKRIKN